jgi:predicted phage baseplate assembly protein
VSALGLHAGRRLIVSGVAVDGGKDLVHQATLVAVQSHAHGSVLMITPPLPVPLKRGSVVVHANVALATHGETVSQILGAGDASRTFQRFDLKRAPLTYRSAGNESGADSEISVRVGEIEWAEKPTMFGADPAERAYTLNTDEQGRTLVVFGDGLRGARLPSGVNNVRATYRQGVGKAGNVRADQLTQLVTRPLGLKSVSNPAAAQGGTEPEGADQARRSMPIGTRTLGRTVSLLDYEDFARAFNGVAKAQAQVLHLPGGPTIAITVAGQDGAMLSDANPVWNHLWLALKHGGDPHVNIALLSHQPITFRVGLKVKRDPAYDLKPLLGAVEAALRTQYSFDVRSLGQPVWESDIIARVHSVPGVVAVDLDFLYRSSPETEAMRAPHTRLLAGRMRVRDGVALAAELLTLDPEPFDRLEELR